MTGKIKGADKARAAIGGMTTALEGVSAAALAAAEANVRFNIAAGWAKSVSDYARFGMDPSKSPSFTAVLVSGARESEEERIVTIQPARFGKTAYFEQRIAELKAEGRDVFRIDEETMAKMREKARSRFESYTMRAFAGTELVQEPGEPVSVETIIDNIRKAIADAVENGLLVQPPPDDHFIRGRYQPMALGREKMDRLGMYLSSYPLYAPRFPSILMNLDPGAFPTLSVTLPDTPRGRRAVAMWLRVPIDRRRRKRAVRILRHELKLAAEARRLWS